MRSLPLALIAVLLVGSGSTARAGDMPSMPGMGGAAACPTPDPDSGAEMLGKVAPKWTFTRWVGAPLSQEKLRGKVVLLRWWNVGCHYCEATLPEIESLRGRYGSDFVTVAVFHPKPPGPVKDADVLRWAEARGYHGALAIDRNWETLTRYWLAGHPERNWTSVSFLIDRDGKIVWVHGGGEYHHSTDPRHAACDRRATALEAKITELLGKSGETPRSSRSPSRDRRDVPAAAGSAAARRRTCYRAGIVSSFRKSSGFLAR